MLIAPVVVVVEQQTLLQLSIYSTLDIEFDTTYNIYTGINGSRSRRGTSSSSRGSICNSNSSSYGSNSINGSGRRASSTTTFVIFNTIRIISNLILLTAFTLV